MESDFMGLSSKHPAIVGKEEAVEDSNETGTKSLPQSSSSEAAVHIIYTESPPEGEEPESYHLRTLASVLGSEDAARESLLYSYKHAASGFSAKLTPEQVSQISTQPGVIQVVQSKVAQLHSGQGVQRMT